MILPISGDIVRQAYKNAPLPIRDAFNSEKTIRIIMDLRSRYQLHVDVAGELGKEVGYLLLGIVSPMEFLGRLVDAGVEGGTARAIANDINQQIFLPLQAIMKNPSSYTPSAQTEEKNTAPVTESETYRPLEAVSSKPSFATVPSIDYTPNPKASVTLPGSSVEVPLSRTAQSIRIPVPTHKETPLPAAPSIVPPLPRPSPPPIYRAPEPAQPPTIPQPTTTPAPSPTPAPIRKEYGADPYREPV